MSMRTQIFAKNYGYGKLLLKTNSTSVFKIGRLAFNTITKYAVIDNTTGEVINQGEMLNFSGVILADLSVSSGDCSLYIDVDDTGNGCNILWFWYYPSYITWVDLDVLPMLTNFMNAYNYNIIVAGRMYNLIKFRTYYSTYDSIDFSHTTNIKEFYIQNLPATSAIQVFDIRNNDNMTHLEGVNYDYTAINVSNHLKLRSLTFSDVNLDIDANINNDYLPELRKLHIYNIERQFDFNNRNLSLLTEARVNLSSATGWNTLASLSILQLTTLAATLPEINSIPNLSKLQFHSMVNLTALDLSGMTLSELVVSGSNSLSVLDLTGLPNLIKFTLSYDSGIAEIRINNGLNSQVTLFQRLYRANTIDVKVDNPTDANNGDAPYFSTIWKNYLDNNSWNFI